MPWMEKKKDSSAQIDYIPNKKCNFHKPVKHVYFRVTEAISGRRKKNIL